MSTYVIGLRDRENLRYLTNVAAVKALRAAGIRELPEELTTYFSDQYGSPRTPGDVDVEVPLQVDIPTREYKTDTSEGFEVDVADIPDGVKIIRFVNSW